MTDLINWPKDRSRYLCSPERPKPKDATGRWTHTNCHEVGDQRDGYPGGDTVSMRCDDCGEEWTTELAQ